MVEQIMPNAPVFTNSEVPVSLLFDWLNDGKDLNRFLENFPSVSRELALLAMDRRLAEKITVDKVIHIDPEIMGGTPVFMGTRVPVSFFFQYLAEGESVESFLEGYPSVLKEHIVALMRRAENLLIPMTKKDFEPLPLLQAA